MIRVAKHEIRTSDLNKQHINLRTHVVHPRQRNRSVLHKCCQVLAEICRSRVERDIPWHCHLGKTSPLHGVRASMENKLTSNPVTTESVEWVL